MVSGRVLTPDEKKKLQEVIDLMEKAWAGCLDNTFDDIFTKDIKNNAGQSLPQICYELNTSGPTPRPSKISDGIKLLRRMLAEDRIRTKSDVGGAEAHPAPGVDSDRIIFDVDIYVAALCSADPVTKGKAKVLTGASMANEMVHALQKFTIRSNQLTSDSLIPATTQTLQWCDAERDSDVSSLKWLDPIVAAMTTPGGIYTNLAAIDADPQRVAMLTECLMKAGVTTPAEIADVVKEAERLAKKKYGYRANDWFLRLAKIGSTWYGYYTGEWRRNAPKDRFVPVTVDLVNRNFCTMTGIDDASTRTYTVPFGTKLVTAIGLLNEFDQVVLMQMVSTPSGARTGHFYLDVDSDGLPEYTEAATLLFPLTTSPDPGLNGMLINTTVAVELVPSGRGLLFLDRGAGRFYQVETGADGLPIVSPANRTLIQHSMLSEFGGAYIFLAGRGADVPGHVRYIFSRFPNTAQFADVPAIWFDVPIVPGPALAFASTTTSLSQARASDNEAGAQVVVQVMSSVVLTGNPGDLATFWSVGRGSAISLAGGTIAGNGESPSLVLSQVTVGNDLFLVQSGAKEQRYFVPRLGDKLDHAINDEDLDGPADRLELTMSPSRLHLLRQMGQLPPSSPIYSHQYELVLERTGARYFGEWSGLTGRVLSGQDGDVPFTPIVGTSPPLFAQSIVDFDGDGFADDAVVLVRMTPGSSFQVRFYRDVAGPSPILAQTLALAPTFEPEGISIRTLDANSSLDVLVMHVDGVQRACYINNGAGLFTQNCASVAPPCATCLGDMNASTVVSLPDVPGMVSALLAGGYSACADVNQDGRSDGLDVQPMINLVRANGGLGTPCNAALASGACCAYSGENRACFSVANESECYAMGGDFLGAFSSCGPSSCPLEGACCLPDSSCVEVTAGQCAQLGGTFYGGGTPCSAGLCPVTVGACCAGPQCVLAEFDACLMLGGVYQGDGSTCSPESCGPAAADFCSIATPLASDVVELGTTIGATTDGAPASCELTCDGNCNTAPDVWYRWTAPASGPAKFTMCSLSTSYDAILTIYDNCGGLELACNDDSCATFSATSCIANFPATAGANYYIRVGGWGGASGPFQLRVTQTNATSCP